MIKWNKERFSVYDSEEKQVLGLVKELGEYTNKALDNLENKTDLNGDHKGSWQGLSRPTLSDEGMRATVENHVSEITTLKQIEQEQNQKLAEIPYKNYVRDNKKVTFSNVNKHYEGFSNFSKKTYGRYEQASVMSVIANKDNPTPQVLGADTKGLATYTNRDSVSLYTENTGGQPFLTIASGMVYTSNKATVPVGVDISEIKPGMIVDVGTNVNGNWSVGIISSINGRELIMEDGFYQVRNDGQTPTKVTPSNGLQCRIQYTNKVWVINSNLFVDEGCPGGANLELGVLCNHANINDVGAIDIINMREATHYGIKVRSSVKPFNENYISMDSGVHYSAKNSKDNRDGVLLRSELPNNDVFTINNEGKLSKEMYTVTILQSNEREYNITNTDTYIIANVSNCNIQLPLANQNRGRVITILSLGTGNLITAHAGNGVFGLTQQAQQLSIAKKGDENVSTFKYISDGNTLWYQIN